MDTAESEIYQRWDDGFVFRRMRRDEEPQVVEWLGSLLILSVDLQVTLDMRGDYADVDGFYMGELNGEAIASLVEIPVADDLRYVGYVYVDERYRRLGFATRMITAAHDLSRRRKWVGIVSLDALQYVESLYEKFDYKTTFKATSYEGTVSTRASRDGYGTDIIEVNSLLFAVLGSVYIAYTKAYIRLTVKCLKLSLFTKNCCLRVR